MNKPIKILIAIMILISVASAAVYHVTTNPEARLFFKLESVVDGVNPMQHMYYHNGFYTNSLGLGLLSSDVPLEKDILHKNTGFNDYIARIYFIIECDEGISIASHTDMGEIIYDGIEDFDSIIYKHPDHTIVEINMTHIEVISSTKVKIVPIDDKTLFEAGRNRFSLITIDFNERSYGNYTLTCDTEMGNVLVSENTILPQNEMTIIFVDSEELIAVDAKATNILDGDVDTSWHTEWSVVDPVHPHEVQVDLGNTYSVSGFKYLPRQDGNSNGDIKDYEFYVSINSSNWGSPVVTGTFQSNKTEQEVTFPLKLGKYIRLVALSEQNDKPWTTIAELNILSTD